MAAIRRYIIILVTLAITANLQGSSAITSALQLIDSANNEYSKGYYDHALELYQKVLDQGFASYELYYNMGNTYFKLNRIPESILFYERALLLQPGDENAEFNLKIANSRIIDKIESLPELFYMRWWKMLLKLITPDNWARLFIALLISVVILLIIFFSLRYLVIRRVAFYSALTLLLATLFSLVMSYAAYKSTVNRNTGIVFDPSVAVKSAPSDKSVDLFVLHEGTKIWLTDQVGEWYEVRIANGNKGWIRESAFERI